MSIGACMLVGCASDSTPSMEAAAGTEDLSAAEPGVDVPTQAEADAAAAEAINQDNADAEFQRLLRELRSE
jgi:hypothetical protein